MTTTSKKKSRATRATAKHPKVKAGRIKTPRAAASTRHRLLTRPELAAHLHCNPRTVAKWIEEGLPVATRGRGGRASRYDEADVRIWLDARNAAEASPGGGFAAARMRKEIAQAVESEQRVAVRAGKLLLAEDVDRTWSAEVSAVRARLLAIPTAWSDRLHRAGALEGAAGIEALLVEAIHQVLRELAGGATPAAQRKRRRPARTRKA
jgi:phage terminase Nu1 subunit (DNA packaging protein)